MGMGILRRVEACHLSRIMSYDDDGDGDDGDNDDGGGGSTGVFCAFSNASLNQRVKNDSFGGGGGTTNESNRIIKDETNT